MQFHKSYDDCLRLIGAVKFLELDFILRMLWFNCNEVYLKK